MCLPSTEAFAPFYKCLYRSCFLSVGCDQAFQGVLLGVTFMHLQKRGCGGVSAAIGSSKRIKKFGQGSCELMVQVCIGWTRV